jgi:hypothetical protein
MTKAEVETKPPQDAVKEEVSKGFRSFVQKTERSCVCVCVCVQVDLYRNAFHYAFPVPIIVLTGAVAKQGAYGSLADVISIFDRRVC